MPGVMGVSVLGRWRASYAASHEEMWVVPRERALSSLLGRERFLFVLENDLSNRNEQQARFVEFVESEFRFLTVQYGCAVTRTLYDDYPPAGRLFFHSATTGVRVEYERNDIFTTIGRVLEPEVGWLSLQQVIDCLVRGNTTLTMRILGEYSFDKTNFENRIRRRAIVLRTSCEPYLRGNFTDWLNLQKWSLNVMIKHYEVTTHSKWPQNERFTQYVTLKESQLERT